MKLLIKDTVFDYQPRRGSNKSEFTDLYICRSKFISIKGAFELYQHRAYRNWKLRSLLDSKPLAAKVEIDDKFDMNAIEREILFHNNKIDKNNNNIE